MEDDINLISYLQTFGLTLGNIFGYQVMLALELNMNTIFAMCACASLLIFIAVRDLEFHVNYDGCDTVQLRSEFKNILFSDEFAYISFICSVQWIAVALLDGGLEAEYLQSRGSSRFDVIYAGLIACPFVLGTCRRLISEEYDVFKLMVGAQVGMLVVSFGMPYLLYENSTNGRFILLICFIMLSTLCKVWWMYQTILFNLTVKKTSTARALHLTLLQSISNFGKFWPKSAALFISDVYGFQYSCFLFSIGASITLPFVAVACRRLQSKSHQYTLIEH
jgi:hypothetical protein